MTNSVNRPVEKPLSPEALLKMLSDMGILYNLYHHRAVFSVGEADDVDADIGGTHTRNLFVRDKKENMFLVTLLAHRKIDLAKLAELIGAGRLSFGSPDRLMTYLGVTPGSVTPFSIINDQDRKVSLILDQEMMESDIVNYHPLINTMTVGLSPKDLSIFLERMSHVPQIIDLTAATIAGE